MGGLASGLKRTIDTGMLDGPRIYPSASYISQTAGHGDIILGSQNQTPENSNYMRLGISQIVDGTDAVRRAVRRNFAEGASQIKIMIGGGISSEKGPLFASQYTDDEIRAAVEEAAVRDTYVAAHVYHDAHTGFKNVHGDNEKGKAKYSDGRGCCLLVRRGCKISTGFREIRLCKIFWQSSDTTLYDIDTR
jgi:imidazolonepropionase-like amidohydrolase